MTPPAARYGTSAKCVTSRLRANQKSVRSAGSPRTRDASSDHVLVVLHSVVTDGGVISAAEQLVAGDAVLRFLRVVPRSSAFTQMLQPAPLRPGLPLSDVPLRIVTAGDDLASTVLELGRELRITLLALGEPPEEARRPGPVRKALARILGAGQTPVLVVPAGARGSRDDLRRILLVLHAPYPAFDLLALAAPLARRSHAELLILPLPSAAPFIPDGPSWSGPSPTTAFRPFDAAGWLERELLRSGCRVRPVAASGAPARALVQRCAELEADLVIVGAGVSDLRVGWRRRRLVDLVLPRLTCPLLFSRAA